MKVPFGPDFSGVKWSFCFAYANNCHISTNPRSNLHTLPNLLSNW